MIKLILLLLLFSLSLLVFFRAPTNLLWYVSILVTEFSWVFILLVCLVFFWPAETVRFQRLTYAATIITILLLLLPYWQAWRLAPQLRAGFLAAFPIDVATDDVPFQPGKIFTGIGAGKVPFRQMQFSHKHALSLNFYASQKDGLRPCVVVIHGGSWAGGNNLQLPELNSELAKAGFHVASIHYRLAPDHRFPAPVADVKAALQFLKENAGRLQINATSFVLLGRSAGGQVALSAAYTLNDPAICGVIDFYGPADMVWGYQNPTNPLVLDSRAVMEAYLGGTLQAMPEQYHRSSATETATAASPPTLLIYAENDPLVSPRHGNKLSEKLTASGVRHYALYLPWATHGFDYTLNGPGGQLSTWAVKHFLQAVCQQQGR